MSLDLGDQTVRGLVLDASTFEPLAGIPVYAESLAAFAADDGGQEYTFSPFAESQDDGSFAFDGLEEGSYLVGATPDGFTEAEAIAEAWPLKDNVPGDSRHIRLYLEPAEPLDLLVRAGRLPLAEWAGSRPTGRSIRSVVQSVPGVHSENAEGGQPSAFGSSDQGVQFSVDGVIINRPEAGKSEISLGFFSVEDVTVLGAGPPWLVAFRLRHGPPTTSPGRRARPGARLGSEARGAGDRARGCVSRGYGCTDRRGDPATARRGGHGAVGACAGAASERGGSC